jgi:ATP-dependent Clp protease, protease subunit
MSLHIVHFMCSINPGTLAGLQNVVLSALKNGATELSIHISSDGGSNDEGFTAYNFLRTLPIPVTMHCVGNVESMALLMYLAGEKRLMVLYGVSMSGTKQG